MGFAAAWVLFGCGETRQELHLTYTPTWMERIAGRALLKSTAMGRRLLAKEAHKGMDPDSEPEIPA